jgi:hypothetical protein
MEQMAVSLFPMMMQSMKRSGDVNAKLDKFEEGLTNDPVEPGGGGGGGGYSEPSQDYQEETFEEESFDTDSPDTSSEIETETDETQENENPDEQNPDQPT